jgi:exonuclease III
MADLANVGTAES